MSPFVELVFEGPCARLTLKRADKLNALDRPMIDGLFDAARAIDASQESRVAILSGEGKAFCAGGDIAAWGGLPPLEMWRDWTRAGHRAFEALARLRVPLIVVSPWAKKNFIDDSITDQSSILRFVEDNWDLGRLGGGSTDAIAGTLNNMFDFDGDHHDHARRVILDPTTGQVVDPD